MTAHIAKSLGIHVLLPMMLPSQTQETTHRSHSALDVGERFVRAANAQACVLGGGRSVFY